MPLLVIFVAYPTDPSTNFGYSTLKTTIFPLTATAQFNFHEILSYVLIEKITSAKYKKKIISAKNFFPCAIFIAIRK